MSDWLFPPVTKRREGTLDELMFIKAQPGEIEIGSTDPTVGLQWKLGPTAVRVLIRRLEAALDAAALMESAK